MEDEKKTPQNIEQKKNKPHHKKGYFISPTPQNDNGIAQNAAPKEEQRENTNGTSGSAHNNNYQNRYHNKNRNRRPHGDHNHTRQSNQSEKNNQEDSIVEVASEDINSEKQTNQHYDRSRHNNNKNRRHHGHKNLPQNRQPKDENETVEGIALENELLNYTETVDDVLTEDIKKETIESNIESDEEIPRVEVVGIRFKSSGKTYYFDPKGKTYAKGTYAIVETARGLEYGEVSMTNAMVKETDTVPPIRPVIRAASPADVKHHEDNKLKEDEAFKICNEKILAHKLDMKLIDAQYTFDNSKLLFYFTSSGRVDFRDLVKDLASVFRTRIELRQIGIRDEAKLMGGLGMCGRPLCCTIFLSDFGQVSIKMAKEQNLSLNSAKISGICGRLMCCLRYEYETYEYEIKRTPPVESTVKTPDGVGTVTEMNPLAGTIKVRLADSPDTPPKSYHRDNVTVLHRKQVQDKD